MKTPLSNGLEITSTTPIAPDTVALINMDIDQLIEKAAGEISLNNYEYMGIKVCCNNEYFFILFKAEYQTEHLRLTVERFEKVEHNENPLTWPHFKAYMNHPFSPN